jgi:hypothetical protein
MSFAGDIQQLWYGYDKKRHSTMVLDCLGGVKVLRNDEEGGANRSVYRANMYYLETCIFLSSSRLIVGAFCSAALASRRQRRFS